LFNRCIDFECNIICICNDTNACSNNNQTLCTNENNNFTNNNYSIGSNNSYPITVYNLIINNSSLFISIPIQILGNSNIDNSSISLISSNININGNLTFINSSLTLSNSSIIVKGCVDLKNNTQFSIDVSNYSTGESIVLIRSLDSCISSEGKISIKLIHTKSNCYVYNNQLNDETLVVTFSLTCDMSSVAFHYPFIPLIIFLFILNI